MVIGESLEFSVFKVMAIPPQAFMALAARCTASMMAE
jgi:hypothetical protein